MASFSLSAAAVVSLLRPQSSSDTLRRRAATIKPVPEKLAGFSSAENQNGVAARELVKKKNKMENGRAMIVEEEFVDRAMEILGCQDSGPPRWFSPIECVPTGPNSPTLLYLPGIDGTGMGLIRHHKRLREIFNVWCLHIPANYHKSFEGLVEHVERTIKSEPSSFSPENPIYLVGESFGACVALALAARNPEMDFVLILANPATSFSKSQLQSFLFLMSIVPEPLHETSSFLTEFIKDNGTSINLPFVEDQRILQDAVKILPESFVETWPYLSFLASGPSAETIFQKLKMLESASSYVNHLLDRIKAQVLVLASGRDQLYPSRQEAERLCSVFPNCRVRHFKDSGHAIFLERDFDLVTTIKAAGYYRHSKNMDYVSDFLLPSPDEAQKVIEGYRWVELATSPVMLSTLEDGSIVRGLAGIPSEGPVILVGYHMLLGLELGPLVSHFFKEKNILLRGIAHPFMFERASELLMPDSSSFDNARLMGAVPVSARNFHKLLAANSFVLLYPGGAREALHRKGEQYKLFWPEQSEFVRMASRFGASIIPFGVVGEDDVFDVILDYEDLMKLPFYDVLDKSINQEAVKLRTRSGVIGPVGEQDLYLPGLLPKFPGRFYFLFGKPIETKGRREELRNKEKANEVYFEVKSGVEDCISYLIEKREEDPYRNLVPRLIYLSINGYNDQVPTFKP